MTNHRTTDVMMKILRLSYPINRRFHLVMLMVAAAMTITFSACKDYAPEIASGNDIQDEEQSIDQTLWMALKIMNVDDLNATRADGGFDSDENDKGIDDFIYNKGLSEERYIFSDSIEHNNQKMAVNFALVFDADGNRIGDLMSSMLWITPDPVAEEDDRQTQYRNYTFSHLKSDFKFVSGEIGADKILVILNASKALIDKIEGQTTFSGITGILSGETTSPDSEYLYYKDSKGRKFFTMSSVMVVSNNNVGPYNTGILKFYSSRLEAENHPLTMYVERLQAKHTLLFQKKGDNEDKNYYYFGSGNDYVFDGYTYKPQSTSLVLTSGSDFEPSEEYVKLNFVTSYTRNSSIKDLEDPTNENKNPKVERGEWKVNIAGWAMNAEEKQEYLFKQLTNLSKTNGYFTNWHKLNYRNFWAEDPNYSNADYPDQFRSIETEGADNLSGAVLNYYPYNSLLKREVHQYTPENTFDLTSFTNLPEDYNTKKFLRAGTHVIVAAQMLIEGFDEASVYASDPESDGLIAGVKDKYCMNGIYWSEQAYKEYVAEYLGYWMLTAGNQEKFGPNDGIFYTDTEGKNPAKGTDFDIKPAYMKGGDGYVYIKPNKPLYTFKTLYTDEGEINAVMEITEDLYMGLLNQHKEFFAGHFNAGRMYYPIAVRHNYRNTTSPLIALADYGVVRNHWYFFTIDNILQPGIPVDDPEEEIVPNPEPKFEGLGVNISILNWHNLNTDVDLSDQVRPSDSSK